MKEMIVSARVEYRYTVKVPDDEIDDFVTYCDCADPVYERISKALTYEGLDFEGIITSIYDCEDEKIIYEG